MRPCCVWLLAAAVPAALSSFSHAQVVTLVNAGFEDDILAMPVDGTFTTTPTGWTASGDAGAFNPRPTSFPLLAPLQAPEGQIAGYLGNGVSSLTQITGATFTWGWTYTLSALIGDRTEFPRAGYAIQLLADGELIFSALNPVAAPDGGFALASIEYTATQDDRNKTIGIRFQGFGRQTAIDDVQLTFVPSPGVSALATVAAIALIRRSRPGAARQG